MGGGKLRRGRGWVMRGGRGAGGVRRAAARAREGDWEEDRGGCAGTRSPGRRSARAHESVPPTNARPRSAGVVGRGPSLGAELRACMLVLMHPAFLFAAGGAAQRCAALRRTTHHTLPRSSRTLRMHRCCVALGADCLCMLPRLFRRAGYPALPPPILNSTHPPTRVSEQLPRAPCGAVASKRRLSTTTLCCGRRRSARCAAPLRPARTALERAQAQVSERARWRARLIAVMPARWRLPDNRSSPGLSRLVRRFATPATCVVHARQCASAISQLKEGSTVVINLSAIGSVDEQQRSIDFVAGGCYAMDGHQECLAEGVFLFAPSDMPVATASSRRDALVSLAKVGGDEHGEMDQQHMQQHMQQEQQQQDFGAEQPPRQHGGHDSAGSHPPGATY